MELINKSFQSVLPTEVVFGKNIVKEELANKLKSLSIRSVLLVSDAGLKAQVLSMIS